jgi:hypothetical protein
LIVNVHGGVLKAGDIVLLLNHGLGSALLGNIKRIENRVCNNMVVS